ncbi:MAG: phospho-sugar mutase [Acidimicrobiia bacterium]|jgi:phosphomannomutase
MTSLEDRALAWIDADPDPATSAELQKVLDAGDTADLESKMNTVLTFGTAGIRGLVGAGPGRMNRAVVMRTTYGLAKHIGSSDRPVVVGFDARPTSRQFAEDTAGVLAGAGIPVLFFPDFTPTPLVAFMAKHVGAIAAVVVTASHNPPADNGYKVYGPDAAQITSPMDEEIQREIESAPPANQIERIPNAFSSSSALIDQIPGDAVDAYWSEVSAFRSRSEGSTLRIVYTPIHGVGKDVLMEVMTRAGHADVRPVPEQAEPDGTFPTVAFPNPEEPGALDLALRMATGIEADIVIANDPDADRLAVVVPHDDEWRPLSGNEIGALLGDYVLRHDTGDGQPLVASSIVSSPMLGRIAASYGAHHEQTLTGFKWIARAAMTLEARGNGRFVFGYEEALGYTVGPIVRDKDGISAALLFSDLVADLADRDERVMDRLHELWQQHGLWVSAQNSIVRPGAEGVESLRAAVNSLADDPPSQIGALGVSHVVDYRTGGDTRPVWLGEQDLIELQLGSAGRVLVRPSGTEPKLKIYADLTEPVGDNADAQHQAMLERARQLGLSMQEALGL